MMMMAVHLSSVIYVISRKLPKLGHFLSRAVATYYDGDDDDHDDDHDHHHCAICMNS